MKVLVLLLPAMLHGACAIPLSRSLLHLTPQSLVDLGFAKHIPTYTNITTSGLKVSIYKNIRFAQTPTEDGIQDGKKFLDSSSCIATAPWYVPFPGLNGTTTGSEDCLFLDVFVPEGVKEGDDVPVLHYYLGSAFAFGSKDIFINPMGLFDYMHMKKDEKFIFVVHNYRLGVSGWLADLEQDLDMNVGMWDSLAAGKWIAKYIHKFGGDRKRVSAIGESAGGSIMYYLTALNEGKGRLPYQQAFVSSPAAPPRRNVTQRLKEQFNVVLGAANCSSLECMRSLSEDQLKAVNHKVLNDIIPEGGGGTLGPGIGFGPVPDGKYITDIPVNLLRTGRFHKDLKRMVVGTMAKEGDGLSADQGMPALFPPLLRKMLPGADDNTIAAIQAGYHYPPDRPELLGQDWTTDVVFACPAYSLATAFGNNAYRYIMSTPPARHGIDLLYLFYLDDKTTPVVSVDLARATQSKVLDYVHGRDMHWPAFGNAMNMFNITDKFELAVMPKNLRERCERIDAAVLDPRNMA